MSKDFYIIQDTREKKGWEIKAEGGRRTGPKVLGTKVDTLDTGDYSIEGLTDLVRVERKNSLVELMGNMTPVSNKDRFIREMERLSEYKYKYLLVETSLNEEMLGLSICQMRGPAMSKVLDWVLSIEMDYGVTPLFVGDSGPRVLKYILRNIAKRHL